MMGILALLFAGLAALFLLFETRPFGLENLPALPIAAGVLIVLVLTYFLTAKSSAIGLSKFGRLLAAALSISTFAAAGYYLSASQQLSKAVHAIAQSDGADNLADTKDGPRSVRLRKRDSGQFVARASINGTAVDLIVDSGASAIVLRYADAERAGIDTSALTFTTPLGTGNGAAFAAPVHLRSVTIGSVRVDGVEALVAKPGTVNESLLGMSFLRRLRSYDMAGDFLTLRQ